MKVRTRPQGEDILADQTTVAQLTVVVLAVPSEGRRSEIRPMKPSCDARAKRRANQVESSRQTFATRTREIRARDAHRARVREKSLKNEHTLALLFCQPPQLARK
jgi:hypothetical protein